MNMQHAFDDLMRDYSVTVDECAKADALARNLLSEIKKCVDAIDKIGSYADPKSSTYKQGWNDCYDRVTEAITVLEQVLEREQ